MRPIAGRITMRSAKHQFGLLLAVAVSAALFGGPALAAGYPERPIELIVPWGPGGGADQLARLVSKLAEPLLGQGLPVVNVPGASSSAVTSMRVMHTSPFPCRSVRSDTS